MTSMKLRRLVIRLGLVITILLSSGLLVACGGGGGSGSDGGGNPPIDGTPQIDGNLEGSAPGNNHWDKMVWDQGKWG